MTVLSLMFNIKYKFGFHSIKYVTIQYVPSMLFGYRNVYRNVYKCTRCNIYVYKGRLPPSIINDNNLNWQPKLIDDLIVIRNYKIKKINKNIK